MKTVIILLVILLTACSYLATPFKTSVELAQEECAKIGYKPNSQLYFTCVERQSISIRNSRAAAAAAASANSAAPPINFAPPVQQQPQYRGQTCVYRIGNRLDCSPN